MAKKNAIEILITAKDEATKTFKGVTGAISGMQASIVAAGAILAVKELGEALATTAQMAAVQEAAESKLAVALARHGATSEQALQSALDFASGLQLTTTAGDETTIAVQALLLNMGVLPKNLNKATQASLDFSAATGKDFREAAIQAAKTLSGLDGEVAEFVPQIAALTVEQKKAGAAFDLLASKFGGEAAAQARTFEGRITQLGNVFGDLQEQVGFNITRSESFKTAIGALSQFFSDLGSVVEDIPIGDILVEWAHLFVQVTGTVLGMGLMIDDAVKSLWEMKDAIPTVALTKWIFDIDDAETSTGAFRKRVEQTQGVLADLSGALERAANKSGQLTGATRAGIAAADAAADAATARAAALKTLREEITKNTRTAIAEANKARVEMIENEEVRVKAQFAIRLSEIDGIKATEDSKQGLRDVAFERLQVKLAEIGRREADIAAENMRLNVAAATAAMDAEKPKLDAAMEGFWSFEASQESVDRVRDIQNQLVLVGVEGAALIKERMSQQLAALDVELERELILVEEHEARKKLIKAEAGQEIIAIEKQNFDELNAMAISLGGQMANLLATNLRKGLDGEKVSTEEAVKGFMLIIVNAALAASGLGFLSPVAGALIGSVGSRSQNRHLGGMITGHTGITSNPREQLILGKEREAMLSESAVSRLGGPASVIALNAGTGGGGGGSQVSVTIQAIDGPSTEQWMRHRGGGAVVVDYLRREGIGG